MPQGVKSALSTKSNPPPVLQPADNSKAASSSKSRAEQVHELHRRVGDQMFGERTPINVEVGNESPQAAVDGKSNILVFQN